MIRLLVDSSADYHMDELKEQKIEMVPLNVMVNDKTYRDEVELGREDFYKKLLEGAALKTSQPSPQDYVDIFEDVKEKGDQIICLTLSSGLSGTYQSACLAKNMVDYDGIYIVDTLLAAVGIRILADKAKQKINEGKSAQEIAEDLEVLKKKIKIYACLDTVKYLYQGGRISKKAAIVAGAARIKPCITFAEDGSAKMDGKHLGTRRAVKDYVKRIENIELDPEYPFYLIYSHDDSNARKLETALKEKGVHISGIFDMGATLGVHVGPNAMGMVIVEKNNKKECLTPLFDSNFEP